MSSATSESVRRELIEALQLDLVGPDNAHAFARELLPEPPSRWYLAGFLVPTGAALERRSDPSAQEEMDLDGETDGTDDASTPEKAAARRGPMPSSMGLTTLVPSGVSELTVHVAWGDYCVESGEEVDDEAEQETELDEPTDKDGDDKPGSKQPRKAWRRTPYSEQMAIPITQTGIRAYDVPHSGGLRMRVVVRPISPLVTAGGRLPAGTRSVSVFLVNERPDIKEEPDPSWAFQTSLRVESTLPFVARPDLRGEGDGELDNEWDELLADLHYRNVYEFAVGHGVSVCAESNSVGECFAVATTWMPEGEVERVVAAKIDGVELRMEELGAISDPNEAEAKLMPLVVEYRDWIMKQDVVTSSLGVKRLKTAQDLLLEASTAANRIEEGIKLLQDPQVFEAFKIANRTMARAARQREAIVRGKRPEDIQPPAWRPFQLGFLLMTMRSIVQPNHSEREIVDLLFFPTGGGKTEAYLGLAAFTMVLRRLRNDHPLYAGVSVLMRYTLRLLTLDQLGRAAALICALELERDKQPEVLGTWQFEIGLWVGSGATPNRMGCKGYKGPGADYTAYKKTFQFRKESKKNPAPIPLENCPWCGEKFAPDSFRLIPNETKPLDLRVHCVNYKCEFSGDHALPIVSVDEPIYRRLPAFVIATVDKFAALPWIGETGALFGLVDRYDKNGYYGPCQLGQGSVMNAQLPPPDLIIQDELHLISGPLGTIAGVYEAAIDCLSTRQIDGKRVRPKIIASTATVRRADKQIRALFERQLVSIFPPPGPNIEDSFFAKTESADVTPARLYVGVTAPGRSLKVVFLRANLALLSAGLRIYDREGGDLNLNNPADPYLTLLGYFNSLRELGGSRRIVED